ncbi:hypothetical protein FSP39_021560 [Pinctada imbricata]|uniref:Zinc finger CCHC-type and RNA-binding motif-containing protein 1 n=1 Tax=Pinctada imbricata TaxID=66713 RepID=A0AA88YS85_PINIB|nr:hypothetical protein FSP39_021560 [Pinctada imbricata]
MSGGLAPSKSTIYVGNLPFSLTNNDLHKIFEKYGKIAKVTIAKDKHSHRSKGVAFILFVERDSAYKAVRALNGTVMFGRTIKCSIAKDNGRTTEFIRRKNYPDKSKCYECGEEGHMSYNCPKNLLGDREPPPKKEKKRKKTDDDQEDEEVDSDSDEATEDPALDSLAAAINYQRAQMERDASRYGESSSFLPELLEEPKRKKYKKDAYFSDEEEIADD